MSRPRKVPPPCKACKHFVSAHRYVPDDAVPNRGPQHCTVPGCGCAVYVNPRRPEPPK